MFYCLGMLFLTSCLPLLPSFFFFNLRQLKAAFLSCKMMLIQVFARWAILQLKFEFSNLMPSTRGYRLQGIKPVQSLSEASKGQA